MNVELVTLQSVAKSHISGRHYSIHFVSFLENFVGTTEIFEVDTVNRVISDVNQNSCFNLIVVSTIPTEESGIVVSQQRINDVTTAE